MRSITTTILLVIGFLSFGQRYVDTFDPKDKEVKSLLGKGNELNGFGGVDLKVTDLINARGLITGVHGGVLINRKYMFGLAGYGIATNIEFDGMVGAEPKTLNLHGGYGGVIIGGMIASKEVIHFTFPVFFGAGALDVVDKNYFPDIPNDAEFTIESSGFIVIEPTAQVEVNITEYFRLAAGASYRYITGVDLRNVKDADLSGTTISVSFRFGRF